MNETITKDLSAQEYQPMALNVNIYPPRKNDPALAAASVCLNGCFVVRGIRIVEGRGGPFVSMPSRQIRVGNGIGYRDTCFPCTPDFHQRFDSAILDAYRRHIEQEQDGQEQTEQDQTAPAPDVSALAEQPEQETAL